MSKGVLRSWLIGAALALTASAVVAGIKAMPATGTGPGDLRASGITGVPFGSTERDLRLGVQATLGQPDASGQWTEMPELASCGFREVLEIQWGGFRAYVARSSDQADRVFVAYRYLGGDLSPLTTPSGVTVGHSLAEVQKRVEYLEYFDEGSTEEGAYVAFIASASPTQHLAWLVDDSVSEISGGWRCFYGLGNAPSPPPGVNVAYPATTTTTSSTTTTTTQPTTTTTRRVTTTTEPFPEWEVGYCVEELLGNIVQPVSCSSPRADYEIHAVVSTESQCPFRSEYYAELDDGTVACFGP